MSPDEIIAEGLDGIYTQVKTPLIYEQFAQAASFVRQFSYALLALKILGIVITVVLVCFFIWFFIKTGRETKQKLTRLKDLINPPEPAKGPLKARWEETLRHLSSFREGEWKFALIEADKIVNDVLENAGFGGETIGEKLKNIAPEQLQSINELWYAHKLRNLVVHDINFKVRHTEVRQAIEKYEKVLRELQVLE